MIQVLYSFNNSNHNHSCCCKHRDNCQFKNYFFVQSVRLGFFLRSSTSNMMFQDSQSIQHLLGAEKRAEEKVNQARKRKILRLKQAKEEAQAEIQNLRAEKEAEFKEYESKFAGSRESREIQIEKDTEKALIEMQKFIKLNKNALISFLIEEVLTIECKIHENFREDDF